VKPLIGANSPGRVGKRKRNVAKRSCRRPLVVGKVREKEDENKEDPKGRVGERGIGTKMFFFLKSLTNWSATRINAKNGKKTGPEGEG